MIKERRYCKGGCEGGHNKISKKNGDAPGPLGDFVMRLVTERTKNKQNQIKKEKEKEKRTKTSLNFTKDVNINFIEKFPLKIHPNISYEKLQIWLQFTLVITFVFKFQKIVLNMGILIFMG